MILPHGFRRLRLAERTVKTALMGTKQRRLLSGTAEACLSALSTIRAVIPRAATL